MDRRHITKRNLSYIPSTLRNERLQVAVNKSVADEYNIVSKDRQRGGHGPKTAEVPEKKKKYKKK